MMKMIGMIVLMMICFYSNINENYDDYDDNDDSKYKYDKNDDSIVEI